MSRFFHFVERVTIVDGDDVRRAPIAAALFRQFADYDPLLRLWGTKIESAGVGTTINADVNPSDKAKSAMLKKGLDIANHKATKLTFEHIQQSSIILTITNKHAEDIIDNALESFPSYKTRVIPLLNYLGVNNWEFPKLLGANKTAYNEFIKKVEPLLPLLVNKLRKDTVLPLLARGHGLGSGFARGRVRIIETAPQASDVEQGDVVICHSNHVSDILGRGIRFVGAIITDSFSEIHHLSTVSNEYGIPCIYGTSHPAEIMQNGEFVLADASTGVVYGSENIFMWGLK